MPEAEGRIVCDPILGDACRGRIQVCGPVSGTFKLEVIAEQSSTYSLNISAHSKELHDSKGLESSDSAADLNQVGIRAGDRNIVLVHYSRDREQKVAVELQQPIRAQGSGISSPDESNVLHAPAES